MIKSNIFQKEYWERKNLIDRRSPTHPVIYNYVMPRINLLKKFVNIDKTTTLLDVGCGNGFFTYYFDKICNAVGIDYSERLIKSNPAKKTFVMDANNLDFPDNSFDIVFANALLHHVDNIDRVLQEMRRVSKKNVIILDANRNHPLLFLFSMMIKREKIALKFSLAYLKKKASENGLRVRYAFSYGLLPPNKTAAFLAPLVKWTNFRQPLGITNFIICEKI